MHRRIFHTLTLSLSLSLCLLAEPGCGGGSSNRRKLDGPFVEVFGAQNELFSISDSQLAVTCKPKPGLGEFEFEAATSAGQDLGSYLRFTLKEYTVPKTYDLTYGPTARQLELKVGFADPAAGSQGYQYEFLQYVRSDTGQTYTSMCTIVLNEAEKSTKTRYYGSVDCVMLWATTKSKDFGKGGVLNPSVDLFASFDCDT